MGSRVTIPQTAMKIRNFLLPMIINIILINDCVAIEEPSIHEKLEDKTNIEQSRNEGMKKFNQYEPP